MECALDVEWLSGTLVIERGTFEDYRELERFHYLGKRPAVRAGVWRVIYRGEKQWRIENCKFSIAKSSIGRVIAVGVLAYPVPSCAARERVLGIVGERYAVEKIRWLNTNVRTISRVIVHPVFRGVGVASALVRAMCDGSAMPYVEAMAVMGLAVPFFERGGMTRFEPADGKPVYYLWERAGQAK